MRTRNMGPYKHGWSQILIIYAIELINMAYGIMNIKSWHAKNQQYEKHVNKMGVRDRYQKPWGCISMSPNQGGPSTLKVMHPNSPL